MRSAFLTGWLVFFALACGAQPSGPVTEQPQILKGSEHGVGRLVPDMALHDVRGGELKLSSLARDRALVIVFFSAYCPISNKLGPELARLEKDYPTNRVRFLFVSPIAAENAGDLQDYAAKFGLRSTLARDTGGGLVKVLGATTTTEAFVLDVARTLVYRGAVNDQYGLGYSKEAPAKNYLRDALDAVLRGEKPSIAATTAPGCALDLSGADISSTNQPITYYNQVSRIVQANCVACHREDGPAPFSLETCDDLVAHAGMVKRMVSRGLMPPWFAAKQAGEPEGWWANDRSLSDADKGDLLAWLDSDRPKGDPAVAPLPRHFSGEWNIGKPDVTLQIPKPVTIKAEGIMKYQVQLVQTHFPEDRWVQAFELMPTARSVVHHVIVIVGDNDSLWKNFDGGISGFWANYVPGSEYTVFPAGCALKLPANATLLFQIHYTPNGVATNDQMKLGLVFAKQPPQNEIHVLGIAQTNLCIRPNDAHSVQTVEYTLPADMSIMAYKPHTHLRGTAFKFELTKPDGSQETLLDVPHLDFNWQLQYDYHRPRFIPAGSRIKVTAVYDNSAANPANPDPGKTVQWGLQTYEEMLIGYVEYVTPMKPAAEKKN